MKKYLLIFILLFIPLSVSATSKIDITNDVEIKTKWYKEVKEEVYYEEGKELEGYIEDKSNIIEPTAVNWQEETCKTSYSKKRITREYKIIKDINKLEIYNLNNFSDISILYKGDDIRSYLSQNYKNNSKEITFEEYINPEYLVIFINSLDEFKIILKHDEESILEVTNYSNINMISLTSHWIKFDNSYNIKITYDEELSGKYTKLVKEYEECTNDVPKTYRYKISREYYDDNYYTYIEGYISDKDTMKIYYQQKEITKEVIKYVESDPVTEIEYIEVEKDPVIEYKYIDKEIIKNVIPKKIYLIIGVLSLIILLEFILLIKKNVD